MTTNKNGREMAIDALQASLDKLIAQRQRIDQDIDAVNRAMDVLSHEGINGDFDEEISAAYSKLGPGQAVEKFLRENAGKHYKASEVKRQLERRRFKTKATAVGSLISSTLSRLAESDKSPIREGHRKNVKVYWIEKQLGAAKGKTKNEE